MTNKPKDDREKPPLPSSPDDPLPETERDPAENIEDEGEVPGGGNFA